MDVLTDQEITKFIRNSNLVRKYNVEVDRKSAFEILQDRMNETEDENDREEKREIQQPRRRTEASSFEKIMKSPVTNMIAREVTRGLLGVLGLKTSSRSRSRRSY
jgi:hypothetical protein